MALVLLMSTFGAFELSAVAATDKTRYSHKYLQNGGFEDNKDNYKFSANYVQPVKTSVPYWDTTAYETNGTNGKLEFFKNGSAHFVNSPTNKVVAEGEVAAELNANEVSTIYQRIETVSGSTYTWGLDHRGRDTTDTMVLFIGPEQYSADGKNAIDPAKSSKTDKDQFVKMTDWLKTQYGISYPAKGCSQKYTIYSKPFAANGKFQNESPNADENFSMTQTAECTEEWNLWVISSSNNNTSDVTSEAVNGWSKYGTNCYNENEDSYNDVIKGAGSKLKYDCTYTVPKGQTKTLFAFTSYSGSRKSGNDYVYEPTFGNMLDDIHFKLYQPISSTITEGGNGGVHTGNTSISSDIQNGNLFYSTVSDGKLCTIRTKRLEETDTYKFQGAYVTVYQDDGTPVTRFITIYNGDDIGRLTPEEKLELSKNYFLTDGTTTDNEDGSTTTWEYYFNVSVESPVHIHMMYTKAPYILYDSNGGEPYKFGNGNLIGENLVGFREGYQKIDGVDTSDYYKDVVVERHDNGDGTVTEKITPGFYKSHAALPNQNWKINNYGVGSKFLGWAVTDTNNKQIIIDGEHTATYAPDTNGVGNIVFTDESKHNVTGLVLDATHGVTLTAQWKFGYTAQAQTLVGHSLETQTWENSAVGGWVEETFINDRSNVENHKAVIDGSDRVERTDAYGSVGEKIIFRATPDVANDYVFDGWYTIDENGVENLITTTPNLAISVEQGKSETYYARFKTKTVPVIFHYSESGMSDGYDFYEKSTENKYGKYFQDVVYNETAIQPSGDSKKVSIWYTSDTLRDQEHVFNFSTPITKETHLYASPSFTFNYYNYFRFAEPWKIDVTATLKFDGKYIDITTDANITDYNVYTKKADTITASEPLPSEVKSKPTTKAGKKVNSSNIITSTLTNKSQKFNRIGSTFNDFYLFNMRKPVWVVFDFTYKGITYTTPIKDRCLYNCISNYKLEADKGLHYTSYPPTTKAEVRSAYTTMLNSIQAMHDAINPNINNPTIVEPTNYKQPSAVSGLTYDEAKTLEFVSSTAIRNIEPWGLKYIFGLDPMPTTESGSGETTTVVNDSITNYTDYGVVMFTDFNNEYSTTPTVTQILENDNAVMYSKSNNNISLDDETGKIVAYYVNGIEAEDFDKNTYAVFFAKNSTGTYFSSVVTNSYKSVAGNDTISTSIINYSDALMNYRNKVKEAEQALAN